MEPIVKAESLCFSYGEKEVLRNCSLTLLPGQSCTIMGPSGSGKTTLVRLLAGLEQPSSGELLIHGKVSCMFQEHRLLPWLTAAENVNLILSDRKATLPKAKELLQLVGLGSSADLYPDELSGGMCRRVSLARALAFEADLFLLDEPLSGLDEALSSELMEKIKTVLHDKAIILVTHDSRQASQFGAPVFALESGKLCPVNIA